MLTCQHVIDDFSKRGDWTTENFFTENLCEFFTENLCEHLQKLVFLFCKAPFLKQPFYLNQSSLNNLPYLSAF